MRKTHSLQEVAAVEQERDEALRALRSVRAELDRLLTPRHIDEWHEDMHDVVWWTDPINEPPYIGSPLSCGHTVEMRHYIGGEGEVKTVSTSVGGWPGYHEWWTPLPTDESMGVIQSRIDAAKKAWAIVTKAVRNDLAVTEEASRG